MFNKEKIDNLEKRVKELERIEGISKLSEGVSKRLIHALIDSNNEVVKRVFDDVCVRSVYGTSVFQPPKAGDIHASNAVFNGIPDSLKKVEEDKMEAPTIASVLEKARRNTVAIQELLKRTGCSNVNEVISKFELGVSYEKMYKEQISKRKELLAATGCANFSDLKNKFLCKDIKRDELIGEINELSRQRELLDRDLRNQIAKLSDKNQSLMQSEKSLICKLADKNEELKRVEELSDGRYKEVVWLRGELKNQEQAVEKLKDENKQLKYANSKMAKRTVGSICSEADIAVGYSNLQKRCKDLERDKKSLLNSERELQKQVFDLSRDKKYLEMANTALLQETRKIRESLNERIKKLRQRLKKSSIRYRDLKEIISHNGLKSV
nr:MAG TPA: nucleoporin [Caudoviricetes sp.]